MAALDAFARNDFPGWLALLAVLFAGLFLVERRSPNFLRRRIWVGAVVVAVVASSGAALLWASANSVASDGCAIPRGVAWDPAGTGHEGWASDRLDEQIVGCETLMVTSRAMTTSAGRCPAVDGELCVAVWHATHGRTNVSVTELDQDSTWWGVTWSGAEAAIADKIHDQTKGWFAARNCNGGCRRVTITLFGDNSVPLGTETYAVPTGG